MESLKSLENLTLIDERHLLLCEITGGTPSLTRFYGAVADIDLSSNVPPEIKNLFTIAKNLALYSYFCFSLAPELQAKTFVIIEYALRLKNGSA